MGTQIANLNKQLSIELMMLAHLVLSRIHTIGRIWGFTNGIGEMVQMVGLGLN